MAAGLFSAIKDITYVSGFLGRMLFAGDDGVKKVKILSGGEKVRCQLSAMMISGANCLIFDEPTNHLDMESISALNEGMIRFPGVELFACRDHQVVQTTANRIIELLPDGSFIDKTHRLRQLSGQRYGSQKAYGLRCTE
jgi:ATPase subunit of ABC transporter with duplicated ATPase domains